MQDRYIEFAKRTLPRNLSLDGLRVVIDCANGAAYRVAPEALWELGAEVISIGVEPDGFNINHDCGSTAPEALCRKVREMRADIGIALDGDADRVVIVDERGHIVDGDQLLAVIAESWQEDGRLAKPGVVATVMSNLGLERYLQSLELSLVRTPVGDRYVLEHMREHGYNVGGEPSGHIILSDYTTTGDGFVAALQVLAVVKKQDKPVSQVCHRFDAAAAGAQERALPERQAAGKCQGALRHRRRRTAPQRPRPADRPALRHRAGDPRHGRGRRQGAGRGGGRRHRRRADRSRGLTAASLRGKSTTAHAARLQELRERLQRGLRDVVLDALGVGLGGFASARRARAADRPPAGGARARARPAPGPSRSGTRRDRAARSPARRASGARWS